MERSLAAVVLAAGKGTRLKSKLPKVLHRLGGRPLAAYPITAALELEADPVVVVIGHEAARVQEELETVFPGQLRFVVQTEQLGTGHAARVGLEAVGTSAERVLILSGDVPLLGVPTLRELCAGPERLRFLTTTLSQPFGYGRVVRSANDAVLRVVEEKDASEVERGLTEVNAGTYLAETTFLSGVLGGLSADNAQREYYLTDAVAAAARAHDVAAVAVRDPLEVQGVNNRAELAYLQDVQWRQKARDLMLDGVTILAPATVCIDPDVEVAPDVVIHPAAVLRGSTRVERDCEIGVGSVLDDAIVEANTVIHPYSVLESARVGPAASVGPFARLRPGTVLEEGAKVGNFVETKNTVLGPRAKANHLAYLGAARVGTKSNVGAGTITCNYDGVAKYATHIGADVFVGSNSTLVAPLEIRSGAYVAAGSTITEDVSEDALAFGRARQQNKDGRATAVRQRAQDRASARDEEK